MTGAERIAAERQRQLDEEGCTPEHDEGHRYGDLAVAAAVLACDWTDAEVRDPLGRTERASWPMQLMRKHGLNRLRQLEIAGALLAAEIDRLQRMTDPPPAEPSGPSARVPVRMVVEFKQRRASNGHSEAPARPSAAHSPAPEPPLPPPTPTDRSTRWAPVRANGRRG